MNAVTNTNQKFHDRCGSMLVAITITTGTPRQSTKLPEGENKLAAEDSADVNVTVVMIPDEVDTAWRSIKRKLATDMQQFAWPVSVQGAKTIWLVPIHLVADVYALLQAAQTNVKDIMGTQTDDWEAFKGKCFAKAGDFEIPEHKFPYKTADDYIDGFKLMSTTESITPGSLTNLPTEVVDLVMDSAFQKLDMMLDNIRNDFITECMALSGKIAGDINITKSTFNTMLGQCKLAGAIVGDSCPIIERLTTGFPRFLEQHEGEYKKFGPSDVGKNEKFDDKAAAGLKHTLVTTAQQLRDQMQHDPADI